MEALGTVLPIIIYILLVILLVIGIILGIKLIITIDKVNDIADDVMEKVESLNGIFKIASFASNKLGALSSKIVDGVVSFINKIMGLKNGKDEDDDYE
jgi:hypothetical protein